MYQKDCLNTLTGASSPEIARRKGQDTTLQTMTDNQFKRQLVENLNEFIRQENFILEDGSTEQMCETVNIQHSGLLRNDDKARRSISSEVHVKEALENQIPSRILSSSRQSFNIAKSTNSSSRITHVPLLGAEEEM
ncbi:potassium transporter 5 [Forsythia ovata]|uniref:Potassium transporter 5 n=1 Tax=Forsythia ovata TaxID=205694 RepID=A0ABD1T7C8_9LAMI